MKKLNIILLFLLFSTNVLADKITKDGFLTSKAGYLKDQNINNPENKIILIYNHGQKLTDENRRKRISYNMV